MPADSGAPEIAWTYLVVCYDTWARRVPQALAVEKLSGSEDGSGPRYEVRVYLTESRYRRLCVQSC
eukprot:6179300-Pleurochrysis_carterae.AAC.2